MNFTRSFHSIPIAWVLLLFVAGVFYWISVDQPEVQGSHDSSKPVRSISPGQKLRESAIRDSFSHPIFPDRSVSALKRDEAWKRSPENRRARLEVIVVDAESGQLMPNAQIALTRYDRVLLRKSTDASGRLNFELPPGEYGLSSSFRHVRNAMKIEMFQADRTVLLELQSQH